MTLILTDSSKVETNTNSSSAFLPNTTITQGQPKINCNPGPIETANVGGKNAQVAVAECSSTGLFTKTKTYSVNLGTGKTIAISYMATSASGYDLNLDKFEEIVKTIKFSG
jgi:hypothetical protein